MTKLNIKSDIADFARCVGGKEAARATGEGGLLVLETLYAGYASVGEGRKMAMPFQAKGVRRPIDLWRKGSARV